MTRPLFLQFEFDRRQYPLSTAHGLIRKVSNGGDPPWCTQLVRCFLPLLDLRHVPHHIRRSADSILRLDNINTMLHKPLGLARVGGSLTGVNGRPESRAASRRRCPSC